MKLIYRNGPRITIRNLKSTTAKDAAIELRREIKRLSRCDEARIEGDGAPRTLRADLIDSADYLDLDYDIGVWN